MRRYTVHRIIYCKVISKMTVMSVREKWYMNTEHGWSITCRRWGRHGRATCVRFKERTIIHETWATDDANETHTLFPSGRRLKFVFSFKRQMPVSVYTLIKSIFFLRNFARSLPPPFLYIISFFRAGSFSIFSLSDPNNEFLFMSDRIACVSRIGSRVRLLKYSPNQINVFVSTLASANIQNWVFL